ncbi:MAG: SPFH domain-containing protein [Anaerolineae bacterium]|nr:SPFH domain-containing protein [Anaerolineae bacterium]
MGTSKTFNQFAKTLLAAGLILGPVLILVFLTELAAVEGAAAVLISDEPLQLDRISSTYLNLGRDMIPAALGLVAAFVLTACFVTELYGLKTWSAGAQHMIRCMFGAPTHSPMIRVAQGRAQADTDHILVRVGGPGKVITYNNSAAQLEQGGRLTRIVPPGITVTLEPFERIRDTLDLRPMRWQFQVEALSKDGIEVTVEVDVIFQINTKGYSPTAKTPFPAVPSAIFRAATARVMRHPENDEPDDSLDWAQRLILDEAHECLRTTISHYALDALVGIERIYNQHPRQIIQSQLRESLLEPAAALGAQINDVRVGSIKVGDKIAEQWLEVWGQEWQNKALKLEKDGEAQRERARERAKAQAQAELIVEITHALDVASSQNTRISSEILAMQLLEVFNHLDVDFQRAYLPGQGIDTIKSLHNLVYEGLDTPNHGATKQDS